MIKDLCTKINFMSPEEKLLLTPNYIHPGILKRNIAINYDIVSNLKVMTFQNFVIERSVPYSRDKVFLGSEKLFWIIFDIMNSLKGNLKYLVQKIDDDDPLIGEGLCASICDLLIELGLNNISPEDMKKLGNMTNTKTKWDDVNLIYSAYNDKKSREKYYDYSDAVILLKNSGEKVENTFIIKSSFSFNEAALVKSLVINEIDIKADIVSRGYLLDAYKVDTPYQEVLETTRNIMKDFSTSAPIKIGICLPDYNLYFNLFKPLQDKLGKPDLIHFIKGEPFFNTKVGKLWQYFSEWASNQFSVYRLLILLKSGLLNYREIIGDVSAGDFYSCLRYFRKSDLVLFDEKFLTAFNNYLKRSADMEEGDQDEFEDDLFKNALKIAKYFNKVNEGSGLVSKAAGLVEIFSNTVYVSDETSAIAIGKFENLTNELLDLLRTSQNLDLTLENVILKINKQLDTTYINTRIPDYTRPVAGIISDLIYFEFDKLYILGLNEHGIPKQIMQNPMLLDYEKKHLGNINTECKFYMVEDILEEQDQRFNILKNIVKHHLVLSAPLRDLSTGREKLVSRYLLHEWNEYRKTNDDYQKLSRILGENLKNNFVTLNSDESFYNYEMAVSLINQNLENDRINQRIQDHFIFSENILKYKKKIFSESNFNDYWGWLSLNAKRELPVFSASRVTTWVRCPYQYFLHYELFLDKMEDYTIEELVWLDMLAFGNFLHSLFNKFFTALFRKYGKGFDNIKEEDRETMLKIFDELIQQYLVLYPAVSPIYFNERKTELLEIAKDFFDHEIRNDSERLYTEFSFAMGNVVREEFTIGSEEPAIIKLNDGSNLKICGAIDRVDKYKKGRYVLIDYKSGSFKEGKKKQPFLGGALIQAGLYSEIVNQLDENIKDPLFKFYFTSIKGEFKGYEIEYPYFRKHFLKLLSMIVHEIKRGNFVPNEKSLFGACGYCDYSPICADGKKWMITRWKNGDPNFEKFNEIKQENIND